MLRESPQLRPNIYQIMREVCLMRGTENPIKDVSLQCLRQTPSLCFADLHWQVRVRKSGKPTAAHIPLDNGLSTYGWSFQGTSRAGTSSCTRYYPNEAGSTYQATLGTYYH